MKNNNFITSLIVLLGCFLTASCNGAGSSMEIRGKDNHYLIPEYVINQTPNFNLFGGDIVGDRGDVLSLSVSSQGEELSILVFWDRVYESDALRNMAENRFGSSRSNDPSRGEGGIYESRERVGSSEQRYFSSFNPYRQDNISSEDFFIEVSAQAPFEVGGREVIPRLTCKVFFIYDGMLVQSANIGEWCDPLEVGGVVKDIGSLFMEWRIISE